MTILELRYSFHEKVGMGKVSSLIRVYPPLTQLKDTVCCAHLVENICVAFVLPDNIIDLFWNYKNHCDSDRINQKWIFLAIQCEKNTFIDLKQIVQYIRRLSVVDLLFGSFQIMFLNDQFLKSTPKHIPLEPLLYPREPQNTVLH